MRSDDRASRQLQGTPAERGRLLSPDDAVAVAQQIHELDDYLANTARGRDDHPIREWATLSPELRWHYFRRAQAACDQADAERTSQAADLDRWRQADADAKIAAHDLGQAAA